MKFKDADIGRFWEDNGVLPLRVPADVRKRLIRKLQMLDAATCIQDLRVPPHNHLEKLKGDRAGQYSITVSEQWRLCFSWKDGEAEDVEFVDYH